MAQSKNGIEVLECYFNVDLSNISGFSMDLGLGDITGYSLRVILNKSARSLKIHAWGVDLAEVCLPSLEDFTFEIIADLTTTALLNLSLTHRCKKCATPMDYHNRRAHMNGICRHCLRDYTHNKSKWGLTSVEQYKNAECPISHEKLELGSTYITKCCKTGIEWDTFNEYCKKKQTKMIMVFLTSSVQCVEQTTRVFWSLGLTGTISMITKLLMKKSIQKTTPL